MPSSSLVDRAMEADHNGRNPPSDHRLLVGNVPTDIAGKRVDVFWWEADERSVTGRVGRWYSAVVQSYDAGTGTLIVCYQEVKLERSVVGGAPSNEIDTIDISLEHVYLVPDETEKVRRPSITRARAHAHTHAHTHWHTPAFPHSPSELQHRAHAQRRARSVKHTPTHTLARTQTDRQDGRSRSRPHTPNHRERPTETRTRTAQCNPTVCSFSTSSLV